MKETPISAFQKVGGLIYFARMLDKVRKFAAGKLREDFHENIGQAFDARMCNFLRVDYAALRERTLAGGTDEEILAWCQQVSGRNLNDQDVLVWNGFARTRGWRDEASPRLERDKAESRLGHRTDLVTFFDYYEVDEGRAP